MAGRVHDMADMTYEELDALDRDRTLVLLGVSPVEVHGTHMPLKTDYFTVEMMLRQSAKSLHGTLPGWNVLLAPTFPAGSDTLPLPGSIEIRPRIVKGLLSDFGCSMARYGFRYIALMSAHGGPRHDTALEMACRTVMKKHRGVTMFTPTGDIILYVLLGYITADLKKRLHGLMDPGIIDTLLPSDIHAGALETSLGLLYMPELVRKDFQKLKDNILGSSGRRINRFVRSFFNFYAECSVRMQGHRADPGKTKLFYHYVAELINMFVLPEGPPPAHSGYPRHASRVLGRAYADLIMERSMKMIHDVVTGKRDVESTFTLFSRSVLMRAGLYL
jgi:creatinine amidohydrolase/Fe(II)-dependent formamide hydrolase-like protein